MTYNVFSGTLNPTQSINKFGTFSVPVSGSFMTLLNVAVYTAYAYWYIGLLLFWRKFVAATV